MFVLTNRPMIRSNIQPLSDFRITAEKTHTFKIHYSAPDASCRLQSDK